MSELKTPPQDVPAEQAVLGAVLIAPGAFASVRMQISDDDWYRPAHELIWAAMCELHVRGEAIDGITVAAEMTRTDTLKRAGGHVYLAELIGNVATAANVDYHAKLIAESAMRRRFIESMTKLAQIASETEGEVSEFLAAAQVELDLLAGMHVGDGRIAGLSDWHEFMALHAGQVHNWVVPGLIGRKDVWLVIAPPGAGKSTLSRHICWAIAAGRHPFRLDQNVQPKRTLLLDLENDEGMVADESVDFFARFDSLGEGVQERGLIWAHPAGVNLLEPRDAHLLDQVLTAAKPDLVAIGSLNNAYIRKGDWDQAASGVRAVINRLRVKHETAFWIEHHMPKASDGTRRKTPFGSQIFEAWPSHGRTLERTTDHPKAPFAFASTFRGDRGRREMPVGFTRGGKYPWDPIWELAQLEELTKAYPS